MTLADLSTAQVFDEYMSSVNVRLQGENVPVPARAFHAWRILQQDTQAILTFGGPESMRINQWFADKYRSRGDSGMSLGRMLVILGGDPWALNFPPVFGTCRPDLTNMIEGGNPTLIPRITPVERQVLDRILVPTFGVLKAVNRIPPDLYADWRGAVDYAVSVPASFGMSRWASQQAVEKVCKEFLRHRSALPAHLSRSHDLDLLADEVDKLNLLRIDRSVLSKLKCKPGMRYPEDAAYQNATLIEAVEANQASVAICGHFALHW